MEALTPEVKKINAHDEVAIGFAEVRMKNALKKRSTSVAYEPLCKFSQVHNAV